MKKIVISLLLLATLLSAVSCKGNPPEQTSGTSDPAVTTTPDTPSGDHSFVGQIPAITPLDRSGVSKEELMEVTNPSFSKSFKNPLITPATRNAWEGYGVGDPFVMRWNGRYYLYCSTKDGNTGIQCWTSDDLVSWKYSGLCAKEKVTLTAYAPEVVYYNGYFYMYTSPAGNGHYVLRSESPTGPFEVITGNFGHSIDGSVFIDDNGRWYFYSADGAGIKVYSMSAPDKIANDGSTVGASMNGWTEGPMVIKVDGTYYLTYTGNHVWSNGYRINYASSTKSPTSFTAADDNPMIVNTLGTVRGIGHSSSVMGPNMDSYYLVYHSSLGAPRRVMRIDRLVFNGTSMEVLGPTTTDQQAPEMPDLYSYFAKAGELDEWYHSGASVADGGLSLADGGWVVSKHSVGENYSAECNIRSISGGKAGMVFGYTDANNYGTACFDPAGQKLIVTFVVDGKAETVEKALVKSFRQKTDFSKLQLLTVHKQGNHYTFLVNNRTLITADSALPTGAFGAVTEGGSAAFGFMGITGSAGQDSIKEFSKPVPGSIQAITCVEQDVSTVETNTVEWVKLAPKTNLNYLINAERAGNYGILLSYRSEGEVKLKVYQNKKLLAELTLPSTGKKAAAAVFRGLSLTAGGSALTLSCQSGEAELEKFELLYETDVKNLTVDYSSVADGNSYRDGEWKISDGVLTLAADDPIGKILYGDSTWGDYTAEATITPISGNINFGMLIRAKNPSVGGAGNDVAAGSDFVQGYFVGLDGKNVVLGKQNYGWKTLTTAAFEAKEGVSYRMKVEAVGNTLKIYLDDSLLIEYTDNENPFVQGMVGFRGHHSAAKVDELTVTPED